MNALAPSAPDHDRRIEMIGGLASMLGVKASPERLIGYVAATADIPADALALGIRRCVQTWRYPDMPKPADIRAAVEEHQAAEREAEQRKAQDAKRQTARAELNVFGRMSKAAVVHHFGGFIATEMCDCLACFDAQVAGPPRFVPDGTLPDRLCQQCEDSGWLHVPERDGVPASVARCVCHGSNPNRSEATRAHMVDMGRWLHGVELREHEQAQEAFEAAWRGWVARARMPKAEVGA